MSEKHYPYHGGAFDRIVFDGDGSVWVPASEISKLRDLESENASLRGAAQGLGALCDKYKAENAQLKAKADAQWSHIKKLQTELSQCTEKSSRDYGRDLDRMRRLATENAKLRELARKNWFIALSERDALRIHGVDPDDGAYITALDTTMDESRATMRELGIEVE